MANNYIDLLITNNDITLNVGNEPVLTSDLYSIGQDVKHAIIESGLATRLVGERSPTMQIDILNQIELLAENDRRIIPGTVNISRESIGRYLLTANAYNFSDVITIEVTA